MYRIFIFAVLLFCSTLSLAEKWASVTLDNDLFVGQDDGYTNGLYLGLHETGLREEAPGPGFLLKPFSGLLNSETPLFSVNSYTLGQTMVTPEDITAEVPDPNDVPYSGLLFFNNTYIHAQENKADKYTLIVGVVGPDSGAEQSQKFVHKAIGSDEPKGWDYQLKNEIVFQLERGRIWRKWLTPETKTMDAIFLADLNVGTIEASASTAVFLRAGQDMDHTYVTPSLRGTRTSNPISANGGWFVYAGLEAKYIARQIFIDGNTFRDSPSAELDHTQFTLSLGLTYSWQRVSISFASENSNIFEDNPEALARYGSFTFAWNY